MVPNVLPAYLMTMAQKSFKDTQFSHPGPSIGGRCGCVNRSAYHRSAYYSALGARSHCQIHS